MGVDRAGKMLNQQRTTQWLPIASKCEFCPHSPSTFLLWRSRAIVLADKKFPTEGSREHTATDHRHSAETPWRRQPNSHRPKTPNPSLPRATALFCSATHASVRAAYPPLPNTAPASHLISPAFLDHLSHIESRKILRSYSLLASLNPHTQHPILPCVGSRVRANINPRLHQCGASFRSDRFSTLAQ